MALPVMAVLSGVGQVSWNVCWSAGWVGAPAALAVALSIGLLRVALRDRRVEAGAPIVRLSDFALERAARRGRAPTQFPSGLD